MSDLNMSSDRLEAVGVRGAGLSARQLDLTGRPSGCPGRPGYQFRPTSLLRTITAPASSARDGQFLARNNII